MTEKEFETQWQANKGQLLKDNEEYQKAISEYRLTTGADWLLFAIPAVAGIVSIKYIPVNHELIRWGLSALIAVIIFVLCVYVKSLTISSRPLSEIEKEVKERFRKELMG